MSDNLPNVSGHLCVYALQCLESIKTVAFREKLIGLQTPSFQLLRWGSPKATGLVQSTGVWYAVQVSRVQLLTDVPCRSHKHAFL